MTKTQLAALHRLIYATAELAILRAPRFNNAGVAHKEMMEAGEAVLAAFAEAPAEEASA